MQAKVNKTISMSGEFNIQIEELNRFIVHKTIKDEGVDYIIFFPRTPNTAVLHIDYDSRVTCNKFASQFMLVNNNNSIYGVLYVIKTGRYELFPTKITVNGLGKTTMDFVPIYKANDSTKVNVFKDSVDNLLITSALTESHFVISVENT